MSSCELCYVFVLLQNSRLTSHPILQLRPPHLAELSRFLKTAIFTDSPLVVYAVVDM